MKTIMFHYVREKHNNNLPYLHYFDKDNFLKFLDEQLLNILTTDEIVKLLSGQVLDDVGDKILLTFDDGLLEHYEIVFPALKERNLSGIFFINTESMKKNIIQEVHTLHILYGKIGWSRLADLIKPILTQYDFLPFDIDMDTVAKNAYPRDDTLVAQIKYCLNYLVDKKLRNMIFDELMSFIPDFKIDKFYMDAEHAMKMSNNGMIFGYHGYNHNPFSSLTNEAMVSAIKKQENFFNECKIPNIGVASFPYGDQSSYSLNNLEILLQHGVRTIFTADEHSCVYDELLILPRSDCADIAIN